MFVALRILFCENITCIWIEGDSQHVYVDDQYLDE